MCASVRLMPWLTLEFHSYANLEVSYTFSNFPTSILSLVGVKLFLYYLYICWVQPSLCGNKYST